MAGSEWLAHKENESSTGTNVRIWKILAACFALLSLALLISLIVVATQNSSARTEVSHNTHDANADVTECPEGLKESDHEEPKSEDVFDDLTSAEIIAVRDYMLAQSSLNITPYEKASINSNYIYLIQRHLPTKQSVLDFIDLKNTTKPAKEAIVVVFKGALKQPIVEEYIVSSAGRPTKHKLNIIPGRDYPIKFNSRPFDADIEFRAINKFVQGMTKLTYRLLKESYDGYLHYNCTDRCLTIINNAPMGLTSDDRKSWVFFYKITDGLFLHPIDFQIYMDHGGTDTSKWSVLKIIYNNQSFDSASDLMEAYNSGKATKIFIPVPTDESKMFSTYKARGPPQPKKPLKGPEFFEPDGKRYTVSGRHVNYMLWSFNFRVETTTGIQIFDIRFNGDRIIYELSLQEAISFYSGYYPTQSTSGFLDSNWRMGFSSYEMVRGIDCPSTATFFDHLHLIGFAEPKKIRNGVCVFELNMGMPLRRHYDSNFVDGYNFYGGLVKNALVLRTINTVYNYDYVLDYLFYQNGVIEARVSATGYVLGSFYDENVAPYAYPLQKFTAGTVHNHMLNYKIDFDVGGRKNSYEEIEVGIENITNHWIPGTRKLQMVLKRETKKTELDAVYKFNFDTPKYLNFYNQHKRNKYGIRKGYRIQFEGISKQLFSEDWPLTATARWSLYQLAVTKYKESERRSSCLFNQNGATNPFLDFNKFISKESIVDEDLVAWATTGMMHIPHSEDIPNTATPGSSASFYIRPFNFFDEDPSMGARNAVEIRPKKDGGQKIEGGTPDRPVCFPKKKPLNFYGKY